MTECITHNSEEYKLTKELNRDQLLHNLDILKRAASLEYIIKDTGNKQGKALIKSFNSVAYGNDNIDWDKLYNILNLFYGGTLNIIKNKYTNLDETEFRICCLIYSKFSSNEIAAITELSINTVHMKTTNIRKKLGIEKYGNIINHINDDLKLV